MPVSEAHLPEQNLIALAHQIDLLSIEFARQAAAFAASGEYENEGFTTAINRLRFNCHMSSGAAANCVCMGENLERLADSVDKVYNSEMGYAHLAVLARAAADVGEAFNENDLLAQAVESSPGKLHYLCRHYRHSKHPAAVARKMQSSWSSEASGSVPGPAVRSGSMGCWTRWAERRC